MKRRLKIRSKCQTEQLPSSAFKQNSAPPRLHAATLNFLKNGKKNSLTSPEAVGLNLTTRWDSHWAFNEWSQSTFDHKTERSPSLTRLLCVNALGEQQVASLSRSQSEIVSETNKRNKVTISIFLLDFTAGAQHEWKAQMITVPDFGSKEEILLRNTQIIKQLIKIWSWIFLNGNKNNWKFHLKKRKTRSLLTRTSTFQVCLRFCRHPRNIQDIIYAAD